MPKKSARETPKPTTWALPCRGFGRGENRFSPDAAYYSGKLPRNLMRFIEGPPNLGVEVRSESDYGDAAEAEMAEKRADYFAAGTQVVWDVDPMNERIHVYRASAPGWPKPNPRSPAGGCP